MDDNVVFICLSGWLQALRKMVWVYWRIIAETVVWSTPGFHYYQEIGPAKVFQAKASLLLSQNDFIKTDLPF